MPIPGPVIGMLLLFVTLLTRGRVPASVKTTASALLQHLSLLYVPAGVGITMPPLQSIATVTVADQQRGEVLGLFQSTNSLAIILGTAIAGVIFSFSPTAPYWLGAILPALALLNQINRGKLITATQSHRG